MKSTRDIAIIGSNGMLGYAVSGYFRDRGHNVIEITRNEFDIARDAIGGLLDHIGPADIVVNCAGVIKPRIADTSIEEVLKVNSIFPRNLARLCSRYGKKCIHITTDCAFSGEKGQYDETDLFDAEDVYGMSKNAGEYPDCMVLRTSIIGEEKGTGWSLLSWVQGMSGGEANGFTNHIWNGVTTVYLAEIIETIMDLDLYEPGLFHVFSREVVTKYELLNLISDIYGLGITVNAFQANEPCDRSLSTCKPLNERVVRKSLEGQIREMKEFFT